MIHVDVSRCLAKAVGAEHGIAPEELKAVAPRVRDAHAILRKERAAKVYGFYDLYKNDAVFKDIKKSLGLERQGPEGRGLHEETITLSVPYSEECPAKVVLSFRVGHDGPIENAIIEYGLEIIPIYIGSSAEFVGRLRQARAFRVGFFEGWQGK